MQLTAQDRSDIVLGVTIGMKIAGALWAWMIGVV